MLKPLTKEQTDRLLDAATESFANRGYSGTSVGRIAAEANLSVGVIYKYYEDKEALFLACVRRSLQFLDEIFEETKSVDGTLLEIADALIARSQRAVRECPNCFKLYHQITVTGPPMGSPKVAKMIEERAATLYTSTLKEAKTRGLTRQDMDPGICAFFFDNLLMMLHFSYTCDYYRDRFSLYSEGSIDDKDEIIREQLLKFLEGAFRRNDHEELHTAGAEKDTADHGE